MYRIFSLPYKFKTPESIPIKKFWGIIPRSRLQSPYQENSPMNNPMAGSDVYKLIWGAILSPVLSAAECKLLLHNLCKIKRLEDWYVKKLNYKIKIINVYMLYLLIF